MELLVKIIAAVIILGWSIRGYIVKVYAEQDDFSDAPFPLERRGKK